MKGYLGHFRKPKYPEDLRILMRDDDFMFVSPQELERMWIIFSESNEIDWLPVEEINIRTFKQFLDQ